MRYGLCFDHDDVGIYATAGYGQEYLWQRLRDLVDSCWIKESNSLGRIEGKVITQLFDASMRNGIPVQQFLIDDALDFLQQRTAEGLVWRISGNELSLRNSRGS